MDHILDVFFFNFIYNYNHVFTVNVVRMKKLSMTKKEGNTARKYFFILSR